MDLLSDLNGSSIFSQLDLSMGYYQNNIDPGSKKYTSFSIFGEHYEFLRISFGLKNAHITFQKAINGLVGHYEIVKIYIEDILILSPNSLTHEKLLLEILNILKTNNITIKFEKTRFFMTKSITSDI
ncbi:Retrovirus-related Pol polyprotein from transposon gypsy [Dictyocoela muelleri]|nr:Retrovirus-related Pol polyprotein from transposon gypsy [Dictyocoela muelleri]